MKVQLALLSLPILVIAAPIPQDVPPAVGAVIYNDIAALAAAAANVAAAAECSNIELGNQC
jgi:hypothetical protein